MGLLAENVSFGYHCFPVLENINFTAKQGNLICVLGKNGAGKSTLFRCILGLLKGYQGRILVDGMDIRCLKERELAGKIAYIPQNHDSAFAFSVIDMVLMGTTSSFSNLSGPKMKQKKIAMDALEMMKIGHLAERSYAHISGGEQQLVLVARAIAQQTNILIMDEPCANLDYGNQAIVMQKLRYLASKGYLIIQSTHSPEHAFLYADQAFVLLNGTIAAMGKPSLVLTQELLEKMYGIPIWLHDLERYGLKICMPGNVKNVG